MKRRNYYDDDALFLLLVIVLWFVFIGIIGFTVIRCLERYYMKDAALLAGLLLGMILSTLYIAFPRKDD